jgi:hypothetical protein
MAADGEHLVSMLNISRPLIVCLARSDGTLTPWQFPDSWEDGVVQVRSPTTIEHLRAYPSQTHTEEWKADYPRRHPKMQCVPVALEPTPLLMLGLNASRDSFEVVWDPHDIGGRIDPMRLLNFRREQN